MTPELVEQAAPDYVTFLRADEWGRELQHPMQPEHLNDPEAFLHHSAGSRMGLDPIQAMKRLERFSHGRGYATVAYDVVNHLNVATGQVTIMGGREGWRSAATKDRNELGEALCVLGYFHPGSPLSEEPTGHEIEAAAWALVWMVAHGWLAYGHVLYGHRDNPAHPDATVCPGDYLYAWRPHIDQRVTDIIANLTQSPKPEPEPPEETPDMHPRAFIILEGTDFVYAQWAGFKVWCRTPGELWWYQQAYPNIPITTITVADLFAAAGPIFGPKPPGVDPLGILL